MERECHRKQTIPTRRGKGEKVV